MLAWLVLTSQIDIQFFLLGGRSVVFEVLLKDERSDRGGGVHTMIGVIRFGFVAERDHGHTTRFEVLGWIMAQTQGETLDVACCS